ncbi:YraN family protein [Corynebacterium breve]|uniref:UPF0102 protein QP027_07010 n=1 Tax=Corynebacterium breve TaxID=3049799 RepID=A0ABY8VBN3_9CORY|nr:YraN family protein [Corynebacterium breve]WIM66883.1 YraN family protein [Corynebacterium breve]
MSTSTDHLSLARRGENAAADFYLARGAEVLARNVYYPVGELDLIVREPDGTIVFVEVKTRSGLGFGNAESVTYSKLQRMRRAAARWLLDHPYSPVRFDVLALNVVGRGFSVEAFQGVDHGAC